MTRRETMQCVHEPFGDAYYFGPERLAERYENDPKSRTESGYSDSTYRTIFDRIAKENTEVCFPSSLSTLLRWTLPGSQLPRPVCSGQSVCQSFHLIRRLLFYTCITPPASPPNEFSWRITS
jgi:hypothetical protein